MVQALATVLVTWIFKSQAESKRATLVAMATTLTTAIE
jgi:hypothetical protein